MSVKWLEWLKECREKIVPTAKDAIFKPQHVFFEVPSIYIPFYHDPALCNIFMAGKYLVTWASYQMHKIACCTCDGNIGNVYPATDLKGKR